MDAMVDEVLAAVPASATVVAPLELTVVVPTYSERANVAVLVEKLNEALEGMAWEVVFVDDHSPDGTADVLRGIARTDRRVRVIERIGRRGLASACIEGMMSSAAPFIAVMDADLQHDEMLLPIMLETLRGLNGDGGADVVIASRNLGGGSMGEFGRGRTKLSHMGRRISRMVCNCDITDAMSGFFMIEANYLRMQAPRLTGSGVQDPGGYSGDEPDAAEGGGDSLLLSDAAGRGEQAGCEGAVGVFVPDPGQADWGLGSDAVCAVSLRGRAGDGAAPGGTAGVVRGRPDVVSGCTGDCDADRDDLELSAE